MSSVNPTFTDRARLRRTIWPAYRRCEQSPLLPATRSRWARFSTGSAASA